MKTFVLLFQYSIQVINLFFWWAGIINLPKVAQLFLHARAALPEFPQFWWLSNESLKALFFSQSLLQPKVEQIITDLIWGGINAALLVIS